MGPYGEFPISDFPTVRASGRFVASIVYQRPSMRRCSCNDPPGLYLRGISYQGCFVRKPHEILLILHIPWRGWIRRSLSRKRAVSAARGQWGSSAWRCLGRKMEILHYSRCGYRSVVWMIGCRQATPCWNFGLPGFAHQACTIL